MSQEINPEDDADMLPEYDFANGVRGKHHEAYKAGTNVIFLEPDLAKIFKDSDSVNRVLRLLLSLAKENVTNTPALIIQLLLMAHSRSGNDLRNL